MRLISSSQQKLIDQGWQDQTGLPLLLLMESAAQAVRLFINNLFASEPVRQKRILLLAGRGQNGGDAYACARLLAADGYAVTCRDVFPGAVLPAEAALNRAALWQMGYELDISLDHDFGSPVPDLIVDGIFGTGLRFGRPLPREVRVISEKIARARSAGAKVVAIDIPSGVDSDTGQVCPGTIAADHTITFVKAKTGICAAPGRFFAGRIHTAGIGIAAEIADRAIESSAETERFLIDGAIVAKHKIARPQDSHKGMFGKTLIIGGSAGMPGAAVLAARAAARAGTGLLQVAVPEEIAPLFLRALPEALITVLPADPKKARALLGELLTPDVAAVIGPGIGRPAWLGDIIQTAVKARNLLLDADALNYMAGQPEKSWVLMQARVEKYGLPPAVLTPHPGEFRRLAGEISLGDRQSAAVELARRSACVVVLKGASTVVASPRNRFWINPAGHDGLAKGGSGDVLSGLTGSLLAQGLDPEIAAVCGVYLHGLSAEIVAEGQARRSVLPGDIISGLGQAFGRAGWEEPVLTGSALISESLDYM